MNLELPLETAIGYKSRSQIARVLTEGWTSAHMYCPACSSDHLVDTKPGTKVVDFVCSRCDATYQLKALSKPIGRRIVDAAYDAMMQAILKDRFPHLLLLSYCYDTATVRDLLLIPKFCIPQSAIEARKPLRSTARRAGWVGCNILLDLVPPEGRITVIKSRNILPKSAVRARFRQVQHLGDISSEKRGWTLDVLTVLRSLEKTEFTLDDAYSFEKILSARHPGNRHVRAKIRQQLQILRDLGYLIFLGGAIYRWKA